MTTFARESAANILHQLDHQLTAGVSPDPQRNNLDYAGHRWHAYWYARTLFRRATMLEGLGEEQQRQVGQELEDSRFFPLNSIYRSQQEAWQHMQELGGIEFPTPRTVGSLDFYPLPLSPSQIPEEDVWNVLEPAIRGMTTLVRSLLERAASAPVSEK